MDGSDHETDGSELKVTELVAADDTPLAIELIVTPGTEAAAEVAPEVAEGCTDDATEAAELADAAEVTSADEETAGEA